MTGTEDHYRALFERAADGAGGKEDDLDRAWGELVGRLTHRAARAGGRDEGRVGRGSSPSLPLRAAVLLFVVLVVATGVAIGVNAANGPSGNGEKPPTSTTKVMSKRAVPAVVGKTRARAITILRAAGFKVTVLEASTTAVTAGHVIATEPPAGSLQPAGRTVTVVVSLGQSGIMIPTSLIGMTPGSAEQLLVQLGFTLTTPPASPNVIQSAVVPPGEVAATVPATGTTQPLGTGVQLIISSGPPTMPIAVPDVSGQSYASAAQQLTNAGFQTTEATRTVCGRGKDGTVLFTNPATGSSEVKYTQVVVYVGTYAPNSPLCATTSTVAPST